MLWATIPALAARVAKRCRLAFLKPAPGFSRACAHPAAQPPISATHLPPPLDPRTALFQRCSKSNMGVYNRAFYFLVPHQPVGYCGLGREMAKRLAMWHMNHIHVADVSTLAAH